MIGNPKLNRVVSWLEAGEGNVHDADGDVLRRRLQRLVFGLASTPAVLAEDEPLGEVRTPVLDAITIHVEDGAEGVGRLVCLSQLRVEVKTPDEEGLSRLGHEFLEFFTVGEEQHRR